MAKKSNWNTVSYEGVLQYTHKKLIDKYGSITAFVGSEDYVGIGLEDTESGRANVLSYLSLPRNGGDKKVKSIPVIKTILKKIFNIEIESKVEVTRKTTILMKT